MKEDKREGTFIPCGDSLEKMEEISDDALEMVSGGAFNVCPGCILQERESNS